MLSLLTPRRLLTSRLTLSSHLRNLRSPLFPFPSLGRSYYERITIPPSLPQSITIKKTRKMLDKEHKEEEVHETLYKEDGINYSLPIRWNLSVPQLYEDALKYEKGTFVSSSGALITDSGKKKGRSPTDKRLVDEDFSRDDIWWGPVNTKLSEHVFMINHERAVDYLNTRERLYVFDGYAGWDPKYRIKIRVVCARAYHGTFSLMLT